MKKLFYYSIALLAAVSCAKEIAPQDNVEAPKGDLKTFTIGASIDNSTIAPQDLTKANLDAETLEVLWQVKDTIGLVTADGAITPAWLADGYDGKAEGVFSYQAEAEIAPVYAYYPYSSKAKVCQQSVEGGKLNISLIPGQQRVNNGLVRQNTLIMVAKADGVSVVFKNTCAIAMISVKGNNPVVTRHLYVNSPNAALSGAGTVDMTSDNPVFVAAPIDEVAANNNVIATRYSYIDIDAKGTTITPGAEYQLAGYLVMPAGTYNSLSFELLSTVGENKQYIQSYAPVKDITLNVGKIRPLNITVDVPTEFTDLSADGKIANCYMIQNESGENFGFRLATRAYSSGKGTNTDLTITNAYNATVLWQSTEGLISSVTYNRVNQMIYFKRDTQKTGNAVIALRSREGEVIYSWNIWVPGETVGTNKFGSYELMDRNLGAYGTNAYTKVGAFYQQGRKDPFPGASEGTGAVNRAVVYPDVINSVKAQDGKSQTWADKHPNVFIWGTDNRGRQDWRDTNDNNLWVSGSSILKKPQDPCPYGYRVPMTAEFDNMKLVSKTKTGNYENLALTIKDDNDKDAVFPIGGIWQRKYNAIELANVGVEGYLWAANGTNQVRYLDTGTNGNWKDGTYEVTGQNKDGYDLANVYGTYRMLFKSNTNITRTDAQVRRWGSNVRCVKFTEVDAE